MARSFRMTSRGSFPPVSGCVKIQRLHTLLPYKVVVTAEAEEDLNQFIQYLLFAKKNKQAAKNVLDDFEDTIKKLKYVASSLNVCDNPRIQSLGYRRINFQQHRYFMLYRIENDVVYVDDIFHELQDYENRMI